MEERMNRLNEAYQYLHDYCNIHTKKQFAQAIGYAYSYVSSAMNGNEKNLTNKFFEGVCEHFPRLSLNYLLNGEGELLLPLPPQQQDGLTQEANMLDIFAKMIRSLDDLRQDLKKEIAEVRTIKSELQQTINHLHGVTYTIPEEQPRLAAEEIKTKKP